MVVVAAVGIGLFLPPIGRRLSHRVRDRHSGGPRDPRDDAVRAGAVIGLLIVILVPEITLKSLPRLFRLL